MDVEALAPDAASLTAARKLARPAPWSELGRDDRAVWGLCKGSGSKPYQVQVDLDGPAFNCSCPSRKFPCKHALALLMLDVPSGDRPAWVGEWLQSRVAGRPKREPGAPVADPEAAARRAAVREERVAAGVEDLRLWLRDALRGGLGAQRLRSWEEWDGFAARMVDAQAPGAASRLRSLGSVAAGRPDGWPERLLSGMGAAAPAVRGLRPRGRPAARRHPHPARLEHATRRGVGRTPRAGPLDRPRPRRLGTGAPARPTHLAARRADGPLRAAARLRTARRNPRAAPAGGSVRGRLPGVLPVGHALARPGGRLGPSGRSRGELRHGRHPGRLVLTGTCHRP